MLRRITHPFSRALANLKKAALINSITVGTIVIALVILATYLFILNNLNRWISVSKERFTIEAFVQEPFKQSKVRGVLKQITSLKNVKAAKLVSKKQARSDFLKKHPDFKNLIDDLDDNPFPATFVIKLSTTIPKEVKEIASKISQIDIIESVNYGARWLERYLAFVGALKMGGYIFTTLIVLACIFLISNSIRLNILTRKDEIEIYKLVGGTRSFIAAPFIIEGCFLGLIGAFLALALLFSVYQLALFGMGPEMRYFVGGLKIDFLDAGNMLCILAIGSFAGLVGSTLSLHRFLRS